MPNRELCKQCWSVIDAGDPSGLCARCGGNAREGATVEPPVQYNAEPHGNEPLETFPTRPAGVGNNIEDNPELKVRR